MLKIDKLQITKPNKKFKRNEIYELNKQKYRKFDDSVRRTKTILKSNIYSMNEQKAV